MILVRADLNNAGVNITDFVMESAEHINVGLGAASLVEECTCPKGYVGLSCQVRYYYVSIECAFGTQFHIIDMYNCLVTTSYTFYVHDVYLQFVDN